MIQIHKTRGVPFTLTIPLTEISEGEVNTPVSQITKGRIEYWGTYRYKNKIATIKNCFYSKVTLFDDGKTEDVLLIQGYLYDMSDTVAEKALDDFEGYIKMGE